MGDEMMRTGMPGVSKRSVVVEKVQKCLENADWNAAILEMEKLFAIDQDPHVRVRIGDIRRKLNHHGAAVREYVRAAELFAAKGFIVKAQAQYTLIVRLDSSNKFAWSMREMLRAARPVTTPQRIPREYRIPQSSGVVIPRFVFENNC